MGSDKRTDSPYGSPSRTRAAALAFAAIAILTIDGSPVEAQVRAARENPTHQLVTTDPSLHPTVELLPMASAMAEMPAARRQDWQDFLRT